MVDNHKTFLKNLFAFSIGFVCIPLVSDYSQSEMLGETNDDIVLSYEIAVKINAGKVRLSVLIACKHKIVEIGILVVTLLITNSSQKIGVVLH